MRHLSGPVVIFLFFSTLFFGLSACSRTEPSQIEAGSCRIGIINGESVPFATDPLARSTVRVGTRDNSLSCSGVLIDQRHVLTAAHCVKDGKIEKVMFNRGPCDDTNVAVARTEVMRNAGVNGDRIMNGGLYVRTDVTVLTLDGPVPPGFTPVPVLLAGEARILGTLTVAGFGKTEKDTSGLLLKHEAVVDSNSDGTIAAHDRSGRSNSCFGDSGGPWYMNTEAGLRVVALTSTGDPDETSDCPPGGVSYGPNLTSRDVQEFLRQALAR